MVGTGPFKMTAYVPGSELRLERNRDYWKPSRPKVDSLIVKYIREAGAASAALIAGGVQLIYPTAETIGALRNQPNVQLLSIPTASTFSLYINSKRPPLDNVEVRRAIALGLDRDEITKVALLGEGVPTGPFPPSHPWAVPVKDLAYYQRDVSKAKELLQKAGFASGLSLTFMNQTGFGGDIREKIASVVQRQLAQIGITVKLEAVESTVFIDRIEKANYDLTQTNPPYQAAPIQYVIPRANRQGPTPPELQALLDAVRVAPLDQQRDLYKRIQLMEADLVFPYPGLVAENKWIAYRTDLVANVKSDFTLSRRSYFDVTRLQR
jgi:peptide/nickel transport system substrate-binding protein